MEFLSLSRRRSSARNVLSDEEGGETDVFAGYHTVNIEKISICLNRGREESVGNDDVSIVCARKYEMVRMT